MLSASKRACCTVVLMVATVGYSQRASADIFFTPFKGIARLFGIVFGFGRAVRPLWRGVVEILHPGVYA